MMEQQERFRKGDLVTYSNGIQKLINKPYKFYEHFDDDYFNFDIALSIDKIQRFIKLPFVNLYRLKTVYKRKGR